MKFLVVLRLDRPDCVWLNSANGKGWRIFGHSKGIAVLAALFLLALAGQAWAAGESEQVVQFTASELFAFADAARDRGDYKLAETSYRALSTDPDIELQTEAHFRLGMMLADQEHKYRAAATEFRRILDYKPKAARVRLELARMQALMGNLGTAEREMRAAEANGLPPEVERIVRFYANALSARKPFGASVEVAIAPDSNINRATRSNTLGTVIGDFTLDQNARARSGVGLALRGQAYARLPLRAKTNLLARLSGSADIYRISDFDDFTVALQAGPEFTSGRDKITISAGPSWRWYGAQPYGFSICGNIVYQHPIGKRTQLGIEAGVARVNNKRNDLQDATAFSLSSGIDRAFSARFGGGLQIHATREAARDPGYSTASGGIGAYLYRELGRATAVISLGYSHLEADQRLFLYNDRRIDNRLTASMTATFRQFRIGSFAPLARAKFERNMSNINIYQFNRIAAEFGITSAF